MNHQTVEKQRYVERLIQGDLSQEEAEAFEEHHPTCPLCFDELHKEIHQQEIIDRYTLGELSSTEKHFFEKHFFACQQCFQQVHEADEIISGLQEASQRGLIEYPQSSGSGLIAWLDRFRNLQPFPSIALAALVLMILLIYPAWQGLVTVPKLEDELTGLQKPRTNIPFYSLKHGLRGESAQRIELPNRNVNTTFVLSFMLLDPPSIPNALYTAEIIEDGTDHVIPVDGALTPSEGSGIFTILLQSASLNHGTYQLKISQRSPANPQFLNEFVFSFEMVFEDSQEKL